MSDNHNLEYYLSLEYPVELVRREEGVFAFHPDLDGCAAQGETLEEAVSNLDAMRRLWLKVHLEDNLPINEPVDEAQYSGRVSLRMSATLHADLVRISRRQRVSVNQLLNNILTEYVGGHRLQQQVLETVREIKAAVPTTTTTVMVHTAPLFPSQARGSLASHFYQGSSRVGTSLTGEGQTQ